MKLDKLAKRLGRDLAANPKKAAALGVMALVALYFRAPLVWGWFSQGERKGAGAGAAELILKDDPEEPAAQTKRRASKFRWEKVRQAIAQDGRMLTCLAYHRRRANDGLGSKTQGEIARQAH